jgi:hypothetical protein
MTDLGNIRLAYHRISGRVQLHLENDSREVAALRSTRDECFRLMASAEAVWTSSSFNTNQIYLTGIPLLQNSRVIPLDEYSTLCQSIDTMVKSLDDAIRIALDPPQTRFSPVKHRRTGRVGRPVISIDSKFLTFALEMRGPTDVAKALGCSPRTIRRRALEHGILPPGHPPFQRVVQDNGTITYTYLGPPKHTRLSDISDNALDDMMWCTLRDFPKLGRRLIEGCFRRQGFLIPRDRIRRSYFRVHGRTSPFGRRPIARRSYHVAGVNSLWHHDGQHGKSI